MQQFCLQDVVFFANKQLISLAQLHQNPSLADMVHLRIDNQKNGQCSQIIATMLSQSLAAQLKHVLHGFLHFSMIMPHLTLSYVLTNHTLRHNSCMLPMMISCVLSKLPSHICNTVLKATNQKLWALTPYGPAEPLHFSSAVPLPKPS